MVSKPKGLASLPFGLRSKKMVMVVSPGQKIMDRIKSLFKLYPLPLKGQRVVGVKLANLSR